MRKQQRYKIVSDGPGRATGSDPYQTHLVRLRPLWGGRKPTCAISYAWQPEGEDPAKIAAQKQWIETFATHLEYAGFDVTLDLWDNMHSGSVHRFVERLASRQFVFLVATPLLHAKASQPFRVVAQEAGALTKRIGTDDQFLYLVLKEGEHSLSVPKDLQGYPSTDFRRPDGYGKHLASMLRKCMGFDRHHAEFNRFEAAFLAALQGPSPAPLRPLVSAEDRQAEQTAIQTWVRSQGYLPFGLVSAPLFTIVSFDENRTMEIWVTADDLTGGKPPTINSASVEDRLELDGVVVESVTTQYSALSDVKVLVEHFRIQREQDWSMRNRVSQFLSWITGASDSEKDFFVIGNTVSGILPRQARPTPFGFKSVLAVGVTAAHMASVGVSQGSRPRVDISVDEWSIDDLRTYLAG